MENSKFLKQKYELHKAPETDSAVKRTEKRTGEKIPQAPNVRIQNYLDRFNEILDREQPEHKERGIEAIKRVLHRKHVIKPKEIPEGYFENQRRIARDLGHGDIDITSEMREQLIEVIVADQKSSMDKWIDYLASSDATYPDWLKYFAIRSILSMDKYDMTIGIFFWRTSRRIFSVSARCCTSRLFITIPLPLIDLCCY